LERRHESNKQPACSGRKSQTSWLPPPIRLQIVLMTFSFQAPEFYERHGFELLASIADHPQGHRNLLMRKRLTREQ
jgi:hypothetical protein